MPSLPHCRAPTLLACLVKPSAGTKAPAFSSAWSHFTTVQRLPLTTRTDKKLQQSLKIKTLKFRKIRSQESQRSAVLARSHSVVSCARLMFVLEVYCGAMSSKKVSLAVSSIPQGDSVFGSLWYKIWSFFDLLFFILYMSLLMLNISFSKVQESRLCLLCPWWMTWDYMCPPLHISLNPYIYPCLQSPSYHLSCMYHPSTKRLSHF